MLSWDGYATAWAALHGGVDPRRASVWVRGWLRTSYRIARVLARAGLRPLAVTLAGLLLSVGAALLAWAGGAWLLPATLLVLLAAVADSTDGALAVITERTSRLGYVYDSLTDRLSEVAWLVALWLLGAPAPLVVAAGGLAWLHEYLRARAVGAGMREVGAVTVAERPTRIIVVAFALFLAWISGLVDDDLVAGTVTVLTAVWLVLGGVGLVQLLTAVRRALS